MTATQNSARTWWPVALCLTVCLFAVGAPEAQDFNFDRLNEAAQEHSVIVDMTIEISFGAHSTSQGQMYLGTVVTADGLIMFNGTDLAGDGGFGMGGFSIKTEPTITKIKTMSGDEYEAEYIGVDDYTKIGFVRVKEDQGVTLKPIEFINDVSFRTGQWLSLYMLLPDFIDPPLAADVGMIASVIQSPEFFPLTVGFSSLQMTSVLFDESHQAVGVLGTLIDPNQAREGMGEGFGDFGLPLLGVITGERLAKLITEPPTQGEIKRGWLGIRLQALTEDMAEFWKVEFKGGIIVNEVIKGSPAESAGLEVGDILVELNGKPIEVNREENLGIFQRAVSEMHPGDAVELVVVRPKSDDKNKFATTAVLTEAPMASADSPEYEDKSFEFTVRNLVFNDYFYLNQDPDNFSGVFVSSMEPGGLAELGGLRFGDIVQRIGSRQISSVTDVEAEMELMEQQRPREVVFFVWRAAKTLFVNVKTDWQETEPMD